jgi:hypothetical protein
MWYTTFDKNTGEKTGGSALMKNLKNPLPESEEIHISVIDPRHTKIWSTSAKSWTDKPIQRVVSIGGFMSLLSLPERLQYYQSRADNVQTVKDAITGVRDMGDGIDLDDPVTSQMLQLLVDVGILTIERKTEILT